MIAVPTCSASTAPAGLAATIVGSSEDQVAVAVTSWVDPSLKVASACSTPFAPMIKDHCAGLTLTPTMTGAVTVRPAVPLTDPTTDVIVAVPSVLPATAPMVLTLAIADCDELHTATCVRFCTVPSEKVPVATSVSDSPRGTED